MKKTILAAAVAVALPGTALASDFNYNYFDGSVAFTEQDNNADTTNLNFEFSSDLDASSVANTPDTVGTFWHAGVNHFSYDDFDVDYMDLFGGVGVYTAANAALDMGAFADLAFATVDTPGGDDSEAGLRLGGFLRFAALDNLDIEGGVTHNTAFDGYTDVYGRALFQVNPNLQLGGGLRLGDTGDGLEVRVRYNF